MKRYGQRIHARQLTDSTDRIRSPEAGVILCVDRKAFTCFRSSVSSSAASSLRSLRWLPYLQTDPETCTHVPVKR